MTFFFKRRSESASHNNNDVPADALIDAYFNRELTSSQSNDLFSMIGEDEVVRDDFDATQNVIDALRAPVDVPDISSSVLDEVGRRRGWLPPRIRSIVTIGRLSVAASFVLVLTAMFLIERSAPGSLDVRPTSQPLTNLVQAGSTETAEGIAAVREGIEKLREIDTLTASLNATHGDDQRQWLLEVSLVPDRSLLPQGTITIESLRRHVIPAQLENGQISINKLLAVTQAASESSIAAKLLRTPCNKIENSWHTLLVEDGQVIFDAQSGELSVAGDVRVTLNRMPVSDECEDASDRE